MVSDRRKKELSIVMAGENNPMWGETHTKEAKEKIREANRQKLQCPYCNKIGGIAIMQRWHFDHCKLSPSYVAPPKMKRGPPTEETKEKVRETARRKKAAGISSPIKGRPQKKDCTCPYCGIECGAGQYSRWHGDNCKSKS